MSILTTFNGIQLDAAEYADLRNLLARVVDMHPVDGDDLGQRARAMLARLPAPTPRSYGLPEHSEPLPRPAQPSPAEWWETRGEMEGEQ